MYSLELEAIGDNLRQLGRQLDSFNPVAAGVIDRLRGKMWCFALSPATPWVAKITGRCERYGLAREFLSPKRDYTHANSTGSRGVMLCYLLDDGIYEVFQLTSWNGRSRYFILIYESERYKISREDVDRWLSTRDLSELMSWQPRSSE